MKERIEEPPEGRQATRRFVASADAAGAPCGAAPSDDAPERGPLLSTRAAAAGFAMIAAAGLVALLGPGLIGPDQAVPEADAARISSLQSEISLIEKTDDALPGADDVERGLTAGQEAAEQVADWQNGYRHLAGEAVTGGLSDSSTADGERNLAPYFAPGTDASAFAPWYLLGADAQAPEGSGLPGDFDSGFAWTAQTPSTVAVDGSIPVVWLATETRPSEGRDPVVLAWASADYDLTSKTFSDVRTGVTAQGVSQEAEGWR